VIPRNPSSPAKRTVKGQAGAWIGSIIVPGLDIKSAPLTDIVVKESEAAFAIKNALAGQQIAAAKFQARLNAKGALAGDFLQGGSTAPFALLDSVRGNPSYTLGAPMDPCMLSNNVSSVEE